MTLVSDAFFIERLPKAEIHLHLEGSVRPATLAGLARKYDSDLAGLSGDDIRATVFTYKDFSAFLRTFKLVCQHLRQPGDYLLLLDELVAELGEENVRYVELIVSPSIPVRFGRDGEEILAALLERSKELEKETGLMIRWILDCVRQFGREAAEYTAELAVRYRGRGVVALGLGGDENSLPLSDFVEVFAWAKAHQLYAHVHAGEVGEPPQIWEALQSLAANRIGHGIQAARDPKLMDYLRQHAVALDVCLTSNLQTGVWRHLSSHPFALLYKRGVPVTLNTDDPGLFQTRLGQEYLKAAGQLGLTRDDLKHLTLQAVHASFLDHDDKMTLMQRFQLEIQTVLEA